jgi:NTE family protein
VCHGQRSVAAAILVALLTAAAYSQTPAATPQKTNPPMPIVTLPGQNSGNDTNGGQKSGTDANSASKPASAGEEAASATHLKLGPTDPSTPPTNVPKDRPVIGLAMGGGAALAMSEIGTLQWLEEHHIPVDVIAGTSMGSILAALYSTGHTPDDMKHIMTEDSVSSVFRIDQAYTARSFRRREDSRDVPNSITIGLRHGAAFRNSLLTDTGLNELLDKEFLRYNDQTDFNNLPIPFRCVATDLNAAQAVTFARGSLQDAVRASASLPGVFRPFELNGHEFVDGAVLENLPTPQVIAMKPDVVIAISLPLEPVGKGDLDSILGVLGRAASVGIEANERVNRKLANVVVMPDISGFSSNDYLKTAELAERGYAAAEANKTALLRYAVTDAQWAKYIQDRRARQRGAPGNVLSVKINAPDAAVKEFVERTFAPLVNHPVDTNQVEKLLANVRADGRYDADYTVGYDGDADRRPILLVTVSNKKTGPPFLDVGFNLAAQTGGVTRATVDTILLDQDLGGFGSELRTKIDFGFYTRFETEYYRKLTQPGGPGLFIAPRGTLERTPFYIYSGETRLSERQLQSGGGGADIGWSDGRDQELRAGWEVRNIRWSNTTGNDGQPDYYGNAQKARVQYIYDSEDRALVPQYGMRVTGSFGYLYATPGSPSAPQLLTRVELSHTFGAKNIVLGNAEGATMFNRNVAQPFRYTLGGPLRLAASAIDQYRGTDYFLVTPGYLRRIRSLGAPLNSSLFLGATYEAGQMRSPNAPTITRQDVYFGLVAQTPFGVISVAPSIGTAGERKFTFTIGKLF